MAEHVFSDFSGGMNALAAVDKLDSKECLLAENCRLDETGNILSAGATTQQNTSSYAAAAGTSTTNIHSLYWNPSIGGVAGVGQDVFHGPMLGGLSSGLAAQNAGQQKMSFASSPNRVYFDVGSVGYWSDMTNLLTVDWAPPSASSAVTTGPNLAGTGTTSGSVAWTNANNITSTVSFASGTRAISGDLIMGTLTATNFGFALSTATIMQGIKLSLAFSLDCTLSTSSLVTRTATFSVTANLMHGGAAVGTSRSYTEYSTDGGFNAGVVLLGNANDMWGSTLMAKDINDTSFGIEFTASITGIGLTSASINVNSGKVTTYQQSSGFVVGTSTSGILSGTYTYKMTFVAANGEESDASQASTSVTLSAQGGTLTAIPTGDARTTSRNIYRKGGSLTSYYLVGSIPDNSTTTYNDYNYTDAQALTAGIILAGDVPGDYPNSRLGGTSVRFPAYHYDRVFWIVPGTNELIWSKPLDGFAYPATNFLKVGDSKPCVRAISIFGELIIFKTDSIWRLTGTDESSFDLSQTPSSVGTDEPFTIVALPDKILFANRYGLWVFNGYTSQPLTPKLDLWFKQDDRTGSSIFGVNGFHPIEVSANSVAPSNFDACGNSEKYYLAYAEAGETANNAVLVFDVKHGNITKRAGIVPLSLALDPVTGYVYTGDDDGFISLLDDWNGTTQGGTNVNFDFQHGYQDLQRGSNKSMWAVEFFLNTNGQSLTPYLYYDNGAAAETLAAISTSGLQRVVRTLQSTNARKCQNFSWRMNGSLSAVNASGVPQIQIVHVKAFFDIRAGRARTGQ